MIRAEELREQVMEELGKRVDEQLKYIEVEVVRAAGEGKSSIRLTDGGLGKTNGVKQLVKETLSDHGYTVQYYPSRLRDDTPGYWTVAW